MKLSNEKIVNDSNTLGAISQKQLPIKVSYAIAKNISKIESELKIYNKEREKLIEKYSIKDEEGKTLIDENNQIRIQADYVEDWNRDIKELLAIDIDIDIHTFRINELLNSSCDMSPTEITLIDYMIDYSTKE